MGIALVQEQGQAELGGQFDLLLQGGDLLRFGGKHPEVVETALADGFYRRRLRQGFQGRVVPGVEVLGVMGMDAGSTRQQVGVFAAQGLRLAAFRQVGAGHQQVGDIGLAGPVQYGVQVVVKTFVGQVDADVDNRRRCDGERVGHSVDGPWWLGLSAVRPES